MFDHATEILDDLKYLLARAGFINRQIAQYEAETPDDVNLHPVMDQTRYLEACLVKMVAKVETASSESGPQPESASFPE